MVTIYTDNLFAFNLLEKAEELFSGFTNDNVVGFDLDKDFYIVFYLSDPRGFITFKAEAYLQNAEVLSSLLTIIAEYQPSLDTVLIDRAIELIEEKLNL